MRPRVAVLATALVTVVTLAACGGSSSAPPSTPPTTAAPTGPTILSVTNSVEAAMAPICDVERPPGKSSGSGSQEEIELLLGRGDCSIHPEDVDTRVTIDAYADANAALTGATANVDPAVERVYTLKNLSVIGFHLTPAQVQTLDTEMAGLGATLYSG
ncbi:MAG TPA: hypothetical protein VG226_12980 [Acidimicrobiales bacterium]|jgi:hypothetical protein|nr:hypothetical protein [Acidimicrobiales bacterium]